MPTEREPKYVALYVGQRVEADTARGPIAGLCTDAKRTVEDHTVKIHLTIAADDGFIDYHVPAAWCRIITEEA